MFISIMIISYMVVGFFVGRKIATDGRKSFSEHIRRTLNKDSDLVKDPDQAGVKPETMFGVVATFLSLFIWPLMLLAFPADKK